MLGSLSITEIVLYIVAILVSLSIHEAMHAFVGFKLGDDTAAEEGRISLNPLKHIDPIMTVALPIVTLVLLHAPILAAKPVPFNPARVKFDEYGAAMIAAAGPLSNLLLAILGALVFKFVDPGSIFEAFVYIFVQLNVALFVFNMIPIPPLDGSRVLYAFSPDAFKGVLEQIEQFGLFIIILLVVLPGSPLTTIILNLNQFILNLLP